MEWKEFKKDKLNYLQDHLEKDKVDLDILDLLNEINSKEDYVTSSSCYGRLSLLEIDKNKKDANFYMKWHRLVTFDEVKKSIKEYKGDKKIWFNCEPFILHIFTKDLESANNFLKICREAHLKRGGIWIIKNFPFIEVFGTNSFSLPIFDKKILISEKYLQYLVKESNSKLSKNFKQIDNLFEIIKNK
ncbi:MAG: hypothetical protein WC356_05130 [Candidatus Micrarchaeia archaeon]|jgi:tRNA wybutosine-synthesizing protein 3